jgi:hypothetical protein
MNRVAARLTAQQKVQRDAEIISDRARGLSWPTIALRHKLSERQCRTIWAEYREQQRAFSDTDPIDAVLDAIATHDAVIEELALLSESANQEAVKLGAIKARLAALHAKALLMQAVGLLPADLGLLRREIETRWVAETIIGTCKKHNASIEFLRDLHEAMAGARLVRSESGTAANLPTGA